jgi:hypothetical protein
MLIKGGIVAWVRTSLNSAQNPEIGWIVTITVQNTCVRWEASPEPDFDHLELDDWAKSGS